MSERKPVAISKRNIEQFSRFAEYDQLIGNIADVMKLARHTSARTVNAVMTATYWEIGRRIVEFEQKGEKRAEYGEELLERLSADLGARFGRGFSRQNLQSMRLFYLAYPSHQIRQTASGKSITTTDSLIRQTAFGISDHSERELSLTEIAGRFPLPWSTYVRLLAVKNDEARRFYESEALRSGWSVRQLDRQIASQFYERTLLSRNKAAMLKKGAAVKPQDTITPEEEIKDPFVLEFLGLKDEYSESDLEEALVRHLETFLLELGEDFAFIARQKRLRIGDEWYRVDLVFFHRRLRCLVLIDLKVGKFTHADAGQMHLYLNYARERWTHPDENPPVGLILCASKDKAVAKYALEGLLNKVLAAEYKLALPDEKLLADELERTQKMLDNRRLLKKKTDEEAVE